MVTIERNVEPEETEMEPFSTAAVRFFLGKIRSSAGLKRKILFIGPIRAVNFSAKDDAEDANFLVDVIADIIDHHRTFVVKVTEFIFGINSNSGPDSISGLVIKFMPC